jgi:hypothetical protein
MTLPVEKNEGIIFLSLLGLLPHQFEGVSENPH